MVSGNIGLPTHVLHSSHQRPAYTTHTSDMVKMFVEQDKLRIARFLEARHMLSPHQDSSEVHVPPSKASHASEERVLVETSPEVSHIRSSITPPWLRKESAVGSHVLGLKSSSYLGGENVVIFSKKRAPLRVFPKHLPNTFQPVKTKKVTLLL